MGPLWQGERGQRCGYAMAYCRRSGARCEVAAPFSGGMSFSGLRLLSSIGLSFDLQDDRSLDQPVKEGHRQRAVGEIVSPFIEINVGDHRRGALLIARGDDLVKQVRRLRTFGALDLVEPEFVNKCSAEHLLTNVKLLEMWSESRKPPQKGPFALLSTPHLLEVVEFQRIPGVVPSLPHGVRPSVYRWM